MKETILEQPPFNENELDSYSPIEIIKVHPDSRELLKIFKSQKKSSTEKGLRALLTNKKKFKEQKSELTNYRQIVKMMTNAADNIISIGPGTQIDGSDHGSDEEEVIVNTSNEGSNSEEEKDQEPGQLKCLIANDEDIQLFALSEMFKLCNFQVQCARNGFEAFEQVKKNLGSDRAPFNMILLDLQMPIADGFEALEKINSLFDQNKFFTIDDNKSIPLSQRKKKKQNKKPVIFASSGLVNEQVN